MQGGRRGFVGGNWKCNNTLAQLKDLTENVINKLEFDTNKVDVIISPVSIQIPAVQAILGKNGVQISAQNCSNQGFGAFTGEICPEQLTDLGLKWTILGHSERRTLYHENDEFIASKAKNALGKGLSVIYCIGETLQQREANETVNVLKKQLDALVGAISKEQWANVVVAYEPVWAIGTGKTATPEIAQDAHAAIRTYLAEKLDKDISNATRLIYGGSVNDGNCADLIKQADIDGFLVGGASLKPAFTTIVNSVNNA